MKAAQINDYGDPNAIVITEVETPTPRNDQVLVEVHASSLNPFDTTIRAGYMKEMIPLEFPITLGGDIAGVISEVGSDVSNFKVGDKVYGQANVVAGNSGALAEYAATAAAQVALAPTNIDLTEAASLPLVGVSAWQALIQHLNLQSGQKLFINGGAGGIGTVAIQIAKNIGAYVAVTATGEGIAYVKELGADQVIDYKSADFAEVIKDYEAALDLTPGADINKMLTVVKSGGAVVSLLAQADESQANELGVAAIHQQTHVTTEALDALRELIESGVVTPHIAKTFPLNQIAEAFTARETGSVTGKVAISIQ